MTKEQILALQDSSIFGKNLYKYVELASWVNWYPDLFLDLITPDSGGLKLHMDQRIYLRSILRFCSTYGVFPRGWGKTFDEVLAMFIVAIRYPDIELSLTAQTKENAAELLKDKTIEILKYYPLFENELKGGSFKAGTIFPKNDGEVKFKSGGRIDVLANAHASKGQRRKRINIEESELLNDPLFQDCIKPIPEVPRYTIGKLGVVNPEELNQQINFFTTSGFRGSDEYQRNIRMLDNMINLKGEMVLGSSWFLACWFGRGSTKSQILQKKKEMSPTAFARNYESKWVGTTDGALVDINKLMNCRTLTTPMINFNRLDEEFYLGVDVARSQKISNNQSSIVPGRVIRSKDFDRIISIEIPNILTVSNAMNFTAQACLVKKTKTAFNAKAVIADGNGLGAGLIDELLKESYDPSNGEYLGCWNTLNTDNQPQSPDAEKCLFDMKAQRFQSKVVTDFIDAVESGKLKLLENRHESDFTIKDRQNIDLKISPYIQTDLLFEEIANLKLKQMSSGALSVEKVVSKIDKDRFSALSYLIFYITEYCGITKQKNEMTVPSITSLARKPKLYSYR